MGHTSSVPSFLQSMERLQQTPPLSWYLVGKEHALQVATSPTASRLLLLPWLHRKRPRFLQEIHVPGALTLWLSSSSSLLTARRCQQEQRDAGPSAGTAWGEGKPGWFSLRGSKARVSELGHKLCQCLVSAHVYLLLGSTQHTEFPHLTVLSFLSPGNTTQRQHPLQCDCHPAPSSS